VQGQFTRGADNLKSGLRFTQYAIEREPRVLRVPIDVVVGFEIESMARCAELAGQIVKIGKKLIVHKGRLIREPRSSNSIEASFDRLH